MGISATVKTMPSTEAKKELIQETTHIGVVLAGELVSIRTIIKRRSGTRIPLTRQVAMAGEEVEVLTSGLVVEPQCTNNLLSVKKATPNGAVEKIHRDRDRISRSTQRLFSTTLAICLLPISASKT